MKSRSLSWRLGRWAESGAALYLRLSGYHILARNVRYRQGEIDVIARRGRFLVFVEVKFRRRADGPLISQRQWRRIANAAQAYLARHPHLGDLWWRFDAIELTPWPVHRRDAWRIYDCVGRRNE